MYQIHPPLSAFPFALLTVIVLLEFYNLRAQRPAVHTAVHILIGFAVFFTVLTFFSGYLANETASQTFAVSDEVLASHHTKGKLLLFAMLGVGILRVISVRAKHNQKAFQLCYAFLLLTSWSLVMWTGWLGGQLVFGHGAGVYASPEKIVTPKTILP